MLAATHIDISVVGVILGVLLGALVFFLAEWFLGLIGAARIARPVAAILALLVFLVCAFDVTSF